MRALWLLPVLIWMSACNQPSLPVTITSPDARIEVNVGLDDGQAVYTVLLENDTVLLPSPLGLILQDEDLSAGLQYVSSSEVSRVEEKYSMHHGKARDISYEANERSVHFCNTDGTNLSLIFRVSNDGIGFRYLLPDSSQRTRVVEMETTGFQFPAGTSGWFQPMSVAKSGWRETNPSYEEHYLNEVPVDTPSPFGVGYVYPALFHVGDHWVLVTETALDERYCGTKVVHDSISGNLRVGFPQPREVWPGKALLPNAVTPWLSPWRVLAIGSLKAIVESTLGTDLATPAIAMDTSIVKPGYASWSWVLLKDDSTVYDVQKRFVDYAADMKWQYTLVDADWDTTIGYERIADLSTYALSKGVGLLLWYNSAGDWNSTPYHPKSKLLTHEQRLKEFSRLREMGIKGVKVDFFGGDGQSMIAYYHAILKDAAEAGLLVNFHGCTLPRGWHRTYPNLMTMEAIKGYEFITFTQDNADRAPSHCAILPFTRNAFDPMDFTPMVLDSIPGIHRRTTTAFELALPTLFLSGIQHMAEIPRGMAKMPDFVKQYLQQLPVRWDETRFISGYPGKDVVIARRSGKFWYISGINGEPVDKELDLDLGFLIGEGIFITDDPSGNLQQQRITLNHEKSFKVNLKKNGGFVMRIQV